MWQINAHDVIHCGRTPGGDRFTEFVDSLIRAQGFVCSLPYADIHTNLRTNKKDGGVDTKVTASVVGDPTGWLATKTIWQYKAIEARDVSPSDLMEIRKWYAKDCISEGYAYRFCICDEIPSPKKQEWENELTQFARQINANAPEAKVLTAGDPAAWALHFPALISLYFRPGLTESALHFYAWQKNVIAYTPTFVPVPTWEPVKKSIKEYLNFSVLPTDIILQLQGEAGVGKTRVVYETLKSISGSENLIFYMNDEQPVKQIARYLANDNSLTAIIVADECNVHTRVELHNLIQGHRQRIRIIAIDNTGERPPSESPEYWIQKMPDEIVEKILEQNFPYVPAERRRAYASLSGGFVRLAADLCTQDGKIIAAGHVGPVMRTIGDYYQKRLSNDERIVVEALALVSRIGFKGDVAAEIENLCSFVNFERNQMLTIAKKLHDAPGFIVRKGRFFSVTPEIIAILAFERAWQRWGEHDPERFLQQIPAALLELFLARVARSAPQEVRRLVGEFFRRWATALFPEDLVNTKAMEWYIVLIETEPDTYMPMLRRLVEQASQEQLLAIPAEGTERWGPRRHLVWLAERIMAFPEYFYDAEAILLRLALAESEPGIGNNATAIWQQAFRIYLSGTATPFIGRLSLLEQRLYSTDEQISSLAVKAFSAVLNPLGTRMAGPPVIAGKIQPEEWYPKTYAQQKACMDAAVSLLCKLSTSEMQRLREIAFDIAISRLRTLLESGYLKQLESMFDNEVISNDTRTRLVAEIEKFIGLNRKFGTRVIPYPYSNQSNYEEEVSHWLKRLMPTDLHGKIVVSVGIDPWHHSGLAGEKEWQAEIQRLAKQLCQNHNALIQELEWLNSESAKSATVIGQEIGKYDPDGSLLDLIIEASVQYKSAALARGYIRGLLDTSLIAGDRLNALLDGIEHSDPKLAHELIMAGGDETNALARTLSLIDSGKLSAAHLYGFIGGIGPRSLKEKEFENALERLVIAVEKGDISARRVAVDFVAVRLKDNIDKDKEEPSKSRILLNEKTQKLIWRLIEATAENPGTESFWWGKILSFLAPANPDRGAQIAANALVREALENRDAATEVLIEMASEYPQIVMSHLGQVMLDEKKGWRFYIGKYNKLIQALPVDIVIKWIQSNGVEAACRLARHLPAPYLSENDEAIVPPLTEFVLKNFENEERVFREFCAGVHSFQLYTGNIAAQHLREAEIARKFLNHPLQKIREWAQVEIQDAHYQAERARQRDEELDIE